MPKRMLLITACATPLVFAGALWGNLYAEVEEDPTGSGNYVVTVVPPGRILSPGALNSVIQESALSFVTCFS